MSKPDEQTQSRIATRMAINLNDGSPAWLRLATPDDRELLVQGFEHLSPESRHRRFFSGLSHLDGSILEQLAAIDGRHHVAVAAFLGDDELGGGIGIARAIQADDGSAELAVTVLDDFQHRGLGELLLRAVVAVSTERGMSSFTALVLTENRPAVRLFRKLGANTTMDHEDPSLVKVTLNTSMMTRPTDSSFVARLRHFASACSSLP